MKNRIKRTTRILVAAIIVLNGYLPLSARYGGFTPFAQTADGSLALPTSQGEQAVQELKQQGLYDSLEEAFAAARYELRWEDRPALGHLPAAYHAPNPAQRLSAYFTPDGLHLTPHKQGKEAGADTQVPEHSEKAEWQATMKLIGYGYQDNLVPVGNAEIAARGNRIEYRRAWPSLTEWYVNKAGGLEQGFTLAAPPGARGEGDRLRLALELTGDLQAELEEGGQAIALKQADGALALRYSHLFTTDANGIALPSQMKLSEGRVILEVDDAGAVYPLTIDPTFTQQQVLTASAGERNDFFGSAVAMTGDTVVVGAEGDDDDILSITDRGSAYVFVRSGTTWSQQAKLLADDGVAFDKFGNSVAISGSMVNGAPILTVVVSAEHRTEGSNSFQGAAYVFVRSGTTWSQLHKLIGPGTGDDWDFFGASVAISGDTMFIGAEGDDIGSNTYQGSVHVYIRSNGTWHWDQMLTASNPAAFDFFGASISFNGSTGRLLVGAPGGAQPMCSCVSPIPIPGPSRS